jgi:hypothetical protein
MSSPAPETRPRRSFRELADAGSELPHGLLAWTEPVTAMHRRVARVMLGGGDTARTERVASLLAQLPKR